jgi:hypothetical protein
MGHEAMWTKQWRMLAVAVAVTTVSCSISAQVSQEDDNKYWGTVKTHIIGATYQRLLRCAGIPDREQQINQSTGMLSYSKTQDMILGAAFQIGGDFQQVECVNNVLIKNGIVTAIDRHSGYNTPKTLSICTSRFWDCTTASSED